VAVDFKPNMFTIRSVANVAIIPDGEHGYPVEHSLGMICPYIGLVSRLTLPLAGFPCASVMIFGGPSCFWRAARNEAE
jgi:hypothetical protein